MDYKRILFEELYGTDLGGGLDIVIEYLEKCINDSKDFTVTWQIEPDYSSYPALPKFKKTWKHHSATKSKQDVFGTGEKINCTEIRERMVRDFEIFYEKCGFNMAFLDRYCNGSIDIQIENGDYTHIPLDDTIIPTWLYYQYIYLGNKKYEERFKEVFNGKHKSA
jgi:hypothetical protein